MSYCQGIFPIRTKTEPTPGVFRFDIECPDLAGRAAAGQFVHIRVPGFTLRRPVSIARILPESQGLSLVFEVRGGGTEALSRLSEGDSLDLMGPLGQGFTLLGPDAKAVFVGGGIGLPPLLEAAAHYRRPTVLAGFRTAGAVILRADFENIGADFRLATDDGTAGEKGTVLPLLERRLSEGPVDILYACGPTPMLRAVRVLALEKGIRCELSLEERMGCGVGACLVCACKTAGGMKQVCKDGPVFPAEEVLIDG